MESSKREKKLKVPQHLIEKSSDLLQEIAVCIALAKRKEGDEKKKERKKC